MNVYQELTILPDEEISPYFLWSNVFKQVHIALADAHNKNGIKNIGVSFPNYRFEKKDEKLFGALGNKLRLFAISESELEILNLTKWLERLADYVHIKSITHVPDVTEHRVVRRYNFKGVEQQARRFAKHKGISFDDALAHCKEHKDSSKRYPFIQLFSEENQIPYRVYIQQFEAEKAQSGTFNTYGINNASGEGVTVPHW